MLRSELKNDASWMVQLAREPFEGGGVKTEDMLKMFGSKISGSKSTFYTDLEEVKNDELILPQEDNKQAARISSSSEQQGSSNEDGNSQDSDSVGGSEESHQQFPRHSFHSIANFVGFSRFRPFVMSTSTSAVEVSSTHQTTAQSGASLVKISHELLNYTNTRYTVTETSSSQFVLNNYAVSESESEEESEETKSSETDSAIVADQTDDSTTESKQRGENICLDAKKKKARMIVEELLATEKHYVNVLHLIDQVFQFRVDQENRAHPMFPQETVPQIFSNVKSIYKFHNDFLLPQLEERMKTWDTDPRIGDIMKNFAPFLKMYTEYVKNFDSAMNLINTLQQKVPRFAAIISDIQKLEECAKLSLAHHMLSPIQRLPRYELLLKDYLRNLLKDSPDYEDTKKALKLVSIAANHTNEAMKKIDKFKKLLEIQESIYDLPYLVSATRELVKEGRIVKISARSGDHQDRHLFLFNDILLLCSLRLIPGPLYRLRAKFYVEELEVREGDNLEIANTFYIRDKNKSVELYTHSAADKAAWLEALFDTMEESMKRKSSLKTNSNHTKSTIVKSDEVSRCMLCETPFSVMKRKHNCRSCGIFVCGKCSNQKLIFEDQKNVRVCRLCYAALTQPLTKSPSSPSGPVPSLLQVAANAPSVLSGYLLMKTQASKPWTRRWFALHIDFVLYTFKSDSEIMALTATPMPGFTVIEATELSDEDPLNSKDKIRAFKIHHSRKSYYLQASTEEDKQRWVHALQLATKAELPQSKEDETEGNTIAQESQTLSDLS